MKVKLLPSILTADFSRLAECLQEAQGAGVDGFHLDIMDGHFVPNLTFGASTVKACRRATGLFLEAHLMATPHDWLLRELVEAGANRVTVHVESTLHLHRSLMFIRELGAEAGVALNPATPLETIPPVLNLIQHVLVMSVNPGFGGQKFIAGSDKRIQQVRKILEGHPVTLGVDGGISPNTLGDVVKAGVDEVVAGSSVFNASPTQDNVRALHGASEEGRPGPPGE